MQLLKKCIDFSWNNINSNQFTHSRFNLRAESICHCSVSLFGGMREKMKNICTLSRGYVRLIGLARLCCEMCYIYAYAIKILEGGNKKDKRVCSLFLLSLRCCTGYDFLWFVEQTYSAGDVSQKDTHAHTHTHTHTHTHAVEYSWREK